MERSDFPLGLLTQVLSVVLESLYARAGVMLESALGGWFFGSSPGAWLSAYTSTTGF